MSCVAIVPARWGSARLAGKPLIGLGGVPMIVRTALRTQESNLVTRVVVATDDARIVETCDQYGIESVMTGVEHTTGTDRVAEARLMLGIQSVVNVQGDEPLIEPETIDAVIQCLEADQDAIVSNAACPLPESDEENPNVAKAVVDQNGRLMYVSRLPLPYAWGADIPRLRHLGLYAFGPGALDRFTSRAPGPLERCERIEMFRYLENGDPVALVQVPPGPPSVDTPEDVARIDDYAKRNGGWPPVKG